MNRVPPRTRNPNNKGCSEAYRAEVGSDNPKLRQEVESLLRSYGEGEFLGLMSGSWQDVPAGEYTITARSNSISESEEVESNAVHLRVEPNARAASPSMLVTRLGNGTVEINLPSLRPGQSYLIETASDLMQWHTIGELNAARPIVADVNAALLAGRFYRARQTP